MSSARDCCVSKLLRRSAHRKHLMRFSLMSILPVELKCCYWGQKSVSVYWIGSETHKSLVNAQRLTRDRNLACPLRVTAAFSWSISHLGKDVIRNNKKKSLSSLYLTINILTSTLLIWCNAMFVFVGINSETVLEWEPFQEAGIWLNSGLDRHSYLWLLTAGKDLLTSHSLLNWFSMEA